MSEKPSYLGLLNAIAVGERGGEELFEAWAAASPNDDVRAVLTTVALREGEHARQFSQADQRARLLGDPQGGPGLPGRVALVSAPTSPTARSSSGSASASAPKGGKDIFANFFSDISMDIETERADGSLRRRGARHRPPPACRATAIISRAAGSNGQPDMAALEARLERIECALAELAAAKQRRPAAEGRRRKATRQEALTLPASADCVSGRNGDSAPAGVCSATVALDHLDVAAAGELGEQRVGDPQLVAVQRVDDARGAHRRAVDDAGAAQAQLPRLGVVVGDDRELAAQQEAGGDDVGAGRSRGRWRRRGGG